MTEVAFHFNAPDRVGYACRLLRKAVANGAQVVVTGETSLLSQLDLALWTFAPLEFVAHGRVGAAPDSLLALSPVVLAESAAAAPHHQVLVNLGTSVPSGFERFERLIEVVTEDADDRQSARERWRHYADRGYAIAKHDRAGRDAR
jgi:DNA polymerase-3 subunit chi